MLSVRKQYGRWHFGLGQQLDWYKRGFLWKGRWLETRRDKLLEEINVNLADLVRKEVRQYA